MKFDKTVLILYAPYAFPTHKTVFGIKIAKLDFVTGVGCWQMGESGWIGDLKKGCIGNGKLKPDLIFMNIKDSLSQKREDEFRRRLLIYWIPAKNALLFVFQMQLRISIRG